MPIVDNVLIGKGSDGQFEYPAIPLGDYVEQLIRQNIAKHGDLTWMTDISRQRSWNYSQLLELSRNVASALKRRGFQTGDTVLVMASNHLEVFLVFLAVWKLGGCVANLTLNLLTSDIEKRIDLLKPKFIFTDIERAPRVKEAIQRSKSVQEAFIIGGIMDEFIPVPVLTLDDGKECPDGLAIDPMSTAIVMFSSGTTGIPKGIVHTYRNLSSAVKYYSQSVAPNRRMLFINPMVNSGGTSIALSTTVAHSSIFTMSNYSEDYLLPAVQEYKLQVLSIFPTQIVWLCRHPSLADYDLSSVFGIITVGSCINPIYEKEVFNKIPNLMALITAYAMSETLNISVNSPTREELAFLNKEKAIARHVVGSSGKLVPFCKLKVIDRDTGKVLGPGEKGEICVSTPYMLKEYLNQPEETAMALRDGWFHTGDEGYYDNDENVFVVGRFKELIKYRMAHVVPTNIEKHLLTHPGVAEAAGIGLPDDMDGERPLAFVVLRPGSGNVTADELVAFIDERVVDAEKLRGGVRFIEAIPRNDLGKVVRPKLKELVN